MAKTTIYRTSMVLDKKYEKEVKKILKKRHVPFLMEEFDNNLYIMFMTYDWSIQEEVNKATNCKVTLNGKEVTD